MNGPGRFPRLSPYLLLVAATLFWSGNFVLARAMHEAIPPFAMAFWRWCGAALLMLPFVARRLWVQRRLVLGHLPVLVALGTFGVAGFNTLVYTGLQSTTATNAVLLNSSIPVAIMALSWVFLGERLAWRQALGVLVSLVGVLAIVTRGEPQMLLEVRLAEGDLWVLAAVVSWAVYTVLLKARPPGLDPLAFLGAIVPAGVVVLLPLYLWELRAGRTMELSAATAASLAYFAVFPSIVSYLCWNRAVAEVGPSRAGLFIHLMPAFGTLLSVAFLGEDPQLHQGVGIALILGGIALTVRPFLR
ncbi:DMT family transporter [Pelomicrobium sp.]|jgi:drug/metabolite transporter (DMT)-like permease|uniref:DMT family transporter n=1 Tax=Pelomicrobium sp. TaxID=2815319 RepID=UPI002FDDCB41